MNSAAPLILLPLSAIYSAVTQLRLAAYQRGLFPVSKLDAPVISVGNMTTGGTGKTPLVEWVCRAILAEGTRSSGGAPEGAQEEKKVCVLTRGYARTNPQAQVVVSNGAELMAGEREAGDEPFLLAKNLLGLAAVICNPDRVAAGKWAIENLGSEAFVLDDGFQHLRLWRDLNIVTVDATNPWGGGALLPYGRLREPVAGLSRADCVVITRAEQAEDLLALKESLRQVVGNVPIFSSRMLTSGIRRLDDLGQNTTSFGSQQQDPQASSPRGGHEPVGAFCGIGNPESFFSHLRSEGYALAFTRAFADHHEYKQAELDRLAEDAKGQGATSLITTAKDAIKLRSFILMPCYVLEIQISIDEETRLVEMIRNIFSKSA